MLTAYNGRTLSKGTKSSVYFNLHRKLFSVKQGGTVRGHGDTVKLHNATFKVSESGRQRVLKEQKKNVHAFVEGELGTYNGDSVVGYRKAYYNPYKVSTFVDMETHEPVKHADEVILSGRTIYYK